MMVDRYEAERWGAWCLIGMMGWLIGLMVSWHDSERWRGGACWLMGMMAERYEMILRGLQWEGVWWLSGILAELQR